MAPINQQEVSPFACPVATGRIKRGKEWFQILTARRAMLASINQRLLLSRKQIVCFVHLVPIKQDLV